MLLKRTNVCCNNFRIFKNQNIKLEVNMKDETVWLNADQIAKLYERDYKTIRKHINNALNEELKKRRGSRKICDKHVSLILKFIDN